MASAAFLARNKPIPVEASPLLPFAPVKNGRNTRSHVLRGYAASFILDGHFDAFSVVGTRDGDEHAGRARAVFRRIGKKLVEDD